VWQKPRFCQKPGFLFIVNTHERWMFVNIQTPGITFAITGPWDDGML
jgi:hypothetical protein